MTVHPGGHIWILVLCYLHTWSGIAGQSCSQNQLNSTIGCFSSIRSKLDSLLIGWPESNVLPNISNSLIADICKTYSDANTCANSTSPCKNDTQLLNITNIAEYICKNRSFTFVNNSDCIRTARNSNSQNVSQCNALNAAVSAMKNQMTSVGICDYYRDASTCAHSILETACGNETGMALTGLLDIVAHQKIVNCSFESCGDGVYCHHGQLCRSSRTCTCATVCPQLSEPVCGNNGINYANPCAMRSEACTSSTWLSKRPQAYCDIRSANPKTCDDQTVDSVFKCASPLYASLVKTLSTTGSFFFAATSQQLTDTCAVYTAFKSCNTTTSSQCPYQSVDIIKQFYDYLCSSQGTTDLTSSSVATCRQALINDGSASKCVQNYNSTLNGLPYFGLKQYPFSLSDEIWSVCTGSNDAYTCAQSRIQALCDQTARNIYTKLYNGSYDVLQQNCNQGCKSTMGDTYGVISTTNWPYRRNAGFAKCTWNIKVPAGLNVNLMIYPNRPFDCQATKARFISVYAGDSLNSTNLIGEHCSSSSTSARVVSTGQSMNRMKVVYSSTAVDGSRSPDFVAMYYAGTDACASNPCSTGTTCVNQIGGYICQATVANDGGANQIQRDVTCNSGWTLYVSKCYLVKLIAISQPDAESGCRDGRGHLTTILTPSENEFVTSLARQAGAQTVWTGLRWEDNTRWKWLTQDGATWTAWNTNQPQNQTYQRCVILNTSTTANGRWETKNCFGAGSTADGYICRSTPLDYCNPNPCQNGGSCQTATGGGSAICTCPAGYTGVVCEQRLASSCSSSPCVNGGTCTDLSSGSYSCACVAGYTGTTCSVNINECASNPCLNGATCLDGINQYTCQCPSGYSGTNCQSLLNPCNPSPCLNNGTCTSTGTGTYTCTCPAIYTGPTCAAQLDPCASTPCSNGGTCTRTASGGYTCTCPAAYTGPTCTLLVQTGCFSNPCMNGGSCSNSASVSWGYVCSCPSPYAGVNCEIGANACASLPCLNGGTCNNNGSTYTCSCVVGFIGSRCETNINECASNPCLNGATCVDGVNEFSCRCAATWSGTLCNQKINNCQPNPCLHQGTCVILSETAYICKCADGFVGVQCENDNDECSYSPCTRNATCLNTFGSYKCVCPVGLTNCYSSGGGSSGSGACASSPCHNGGTCVPNGSGFTCTCATSYSGTTCDTGACDSGWSYNQGYCYTVVTTASTMNDGQKYCIQRSAQLASVRSVDERDFIGKQMAAANADRAWIGARGSTGGWTWTDGLSWTYASWYTNEPKDSSSNACVRMITGYGFSWDTKSCDTVEDFVCKKLANGGQSYCSSQPCQNGGQCVNLVSSYQCNCASGYSGNNCQTRLNSGCGSGCQNGGTCTGGSCVCTQGFTGATCSIPCPSGWTWSASTCYFAVNTLATYDQAVSSCPQKQIGSYLLTTLSQAEFDYAGILMNNMQANVWLGLRYNTVQNQFIWVTGSGLATADFKAWGSGQPVNQQTRNCARITGSTGFIWETEDCAHQLRYICKYKG